MWPDVFPYGPMTEVQMAFFTLSFAAVGMRIVVEIGLWDETACPAFHKQVSALSEVGAVLLLFFFCDRTSILPRRTKKYEKDFFSFLIVCFVAAGAFTLRQVPSKAPAAAAKTEAAEPKPPAQNGLGEVKERNASKQPLPTPEVDREEHSPARPPSQRGLLMNRHQTDEWKGWMQMLFLWYHYYHNTSIYNEIRVFIAAYVWMTGFGNFTYYYNRKDFSLHRFLSTMLRLNFFVVCVCCLMRNEYMLYYICPLHTFFTLMVYLALLVKHSMNSSTTFLAVKLVFCFVISIVLWDRAFSKKLFCWLSVPLGPLVVYHDPYKTDRGVYEEWFFRSFLDHLIWIGGMMTAYAYPTMEAWLRRLDDAAPGAPRRRALAVKWLIAIIAMAILAVHYHTVLVLPKYGYNALHPYLSFIPLSCFLVLRNLSQRARGYYIGLFEWFGKISLETYIVQFHVWMATTGLNGSPHLLLHLIPGDYPACDFFTGSFLMFFISRRAATATDVSKSMFFPPKAKNAVLFTNLACLFALCAVLVALHAACNLILFG